MTVDEDIDQDTLALDFGCTYCKVPPGHWCRTKSGRLASWLHSARSWPIQRAWGLGYAEYDKSAEEDRARRTQALRERMRNHDIDETTIADITSVMERRWFW